MWLWLWRGAHTQVLSRLVSGWTDADPSSVTISDDLTNMYNTTSRKAGFAFLRKRFPALIPLFRLFYGSPADIWLGGRRVPIERTVLPDGSTSTVLGDETSTDFLRSVEGGSQGCGGATLLTVGAYHECLSDVQRMHPDVNIAAIADDTYLNGEGEHNGAVFDCFADKRTEARKINLESKLRKVGVFSPRADLSLAPP